MHKAHLSPEIIDKLNAWLGDAAQSEPNDPTAACLSTIGKDGAPDGRMVLIRIIDSNGFAFFTNYESKKGEDLIANPAASLCFHWKSLLRQIRVQGKIEKTSDVESDNYFNNRPRGSRIGAWASIQSTNLPSRADFETRIKFFENKFKGLENPPRPPHWGGFRLIPTRIEFWQQQEFRLHDRLIYNFDGDEWSKETLYP